MLPVCNCQNSSHPIWVGPTCRRTKSPPLVARPASTHAEQEACSGQGRRWEPERGRGSEALPVSGSFFTGFKLASGVVEPKNRWPASEINAPRDPSPSIPGHSESTPTCTLPPLHNFVSPISRLGRVTNVITSAVYTQDSVSVDGQASARDSMWNCQWQLLDCWVVAGFGRCEDGASGSSTTSNPPASTADCGSVSDGKGGTVAKTCLDGQCCR